MTELSFHLRPPTEEEEKDIIASLRAHTAEVGGVVTKDEPFGVLAFDGDERVAAVSGFCFWNWLFADLVWVHPNRRGTGLGRQIMQKAEEQARVMGLTGIYLWTASWQASDFYAKIGYERYVVFNDFPPGHQRFGFRKYL